MSSGNEVEEDVDGDFPRETAQRVRAALAEAPLDDAALDHDVRVLVHEVLAPSERALHDAYYEGAGVSERSHDAWAQQRGFNSSGDLHAWVDAGLAAVDRDALVRAFQNAAVVNNDYTDPDGGWSGARTEEAERMADVAVAALLEHPEQEREGR